MNLQLNTNHSSPDMARASWVQFIHDLQNKICNALEEIDGKGKFVQDEWKREEGGGGKTRVMANGNVFEKAGVNTSIVFGAVTEPMREQLKINGRHWWASGLSLVLHPINPFVPTVHCNYRMFEVARCANDLSFTSTGEHEVWFGGGTDLTPYYLFEEDAIHFHQTYKTVCDDFDISLYPKLKNECDNYFVNKHRNNERRGIGGIFYDQERPMGNHDIDFWMTFGRACGNAFMPSYLPIVAKRKNIPYTDQHKRWQEIRRGRYVEFNLIHDRGTLFGLKTGGRTESILMSLPTTARFEYNYQPEPGSEEEKLLRVCLSPRNWV